MTDVTDLVWFFSNDPGINALIGTRLYPLTLPETPTFPAATYFQVSRPHEHTHDGMELTWPKYQFDFYGSTYLECYAVRKAFQNAIGRWKTAYGQPAFDEDVTDVAEPDLPPIGQRFRERMDVTFWGLE
jgi:hypothetical protein